MNYRLSEHTFEFQEDKVPITTTTKNALITTQLGPCDVYPHRVKVSIVGIGKIGMACAIAILMRVSTAAVEGMRIATLDQPFDSR